MKPSLLFLIGSLLVFPATVEAQPQDMPSTPTDSPFETLDLRAPNAYRNASGRPGHDYWQQQVDYKIDATLDTDTNEIIGTESIRYVNNSPDDLPYLWLHIEQNACTPESVSNRLKQPPLVFLGAIFDFSCQGFVGGMTINRVSSNGHDLPYSIMGTTMRIDFETVIQAGSSTRVEISWQFNIPPYGLARMGRDGSLFQIAQWHPRLAVYDDVRGWNAEPYIGAGEFYLEYGNFDVTLTVPREFIVAATGKLQNANEVLTVDQRDRLRLAMTQSEAVAIISKEEAGDTAATRPGSGTDGTLNWHFTAESVRDFAFAASPDFRWDATHWNGIRIEALYRDGAANWEEATEMSRESIRYFSEQWHMYPYSHATTIEGLIEGMEYPMLTFVPAMESRTDLHWVVSHEFGHEWFPVLVGSNERFYPWMDEGFNTFMDLGGAAEYFDDTEYGNSIEWNPLALYAENAIPGKEQALITRASEQYNLFWSAYQKPALMLQLLRYEILGEERFDFAFRTYIAAWANKHPTPADFFRIMKDASGMDLDWFWRGWVLTAARLDQAVESVSSSDGQGSSEDRSNSDGRGNSEDLHREGTKIVLVNNLGMVMPVEMEVEFADNTSKIFQFPVEMWNQGSRFVYQLSGNRTVQRVTLDPRHRYPDSDRANNTWPR